MILFLWKGIEEEGLDLEGLGSNLSSPDYIQRSTHPYDVASTYKVACSYTIARTYNIAINTITLGT